MNAAIVEAYEWDRIGTLVDVAGGVGSTPAAILQANRRMLGVLFDVPCHRARPRLPGAAGRPDMVPDGGRKLLRCHSRWSNAYFLKHIIHDWDDEDCLRILRNCKAAMPGHAKLLICEKIVPPGNGPSAAKVMDLVMLVLTDGGRERAEPEFRDLFARAGLRIARVLPTQADNSILELTK